MFDKEKFIDFLLKTQIFFEKLDAGSYNVYLWAQLRARRFWNSIPEVSFAVTGLAFLAVILYHQAMLAGSNHPLYSQLWLVSFLAAFTVAGRLLRLATKNQAQLD